VRNPDRNKSNGLSSGLEATSSASDTRLRLARNLTSRTNRTSPDGVLRYARGAASTLRIGCEHWAPSVRSDSHERPPPCAMISANVRAAPGAGCPLQRKKLAAPKLL
jgi:hypothetical protein